MPVSGMTGVKWDVVGWEGGWWIEERKFGKRGS